MALLTCRPEFEPPWGLRSYLTSIALNRFTRVQIETMVKGVTGGKTLDVEIMQHLVEKTDGVPLYVEEMTKAILESEVLQETNGHYALTGPLASLAIPTTLQDALMAGLDRLGTAKSLSQLGAVLGRTFTYELLHAVSSLDALVVWRSLVELVEAELLYQRGSLPHATFTFKHALIQETAYQSLLKSTRQLYHQRIANVLESQFPEIAETQSELLAYHCMEAGQDEAAIGYWQRAGQHALQHSAYVEAIAHLRQGLEVLDYLPETSERLQQELRLNLALGIPLQATRGYGTSEAAAVYSRARELAQRLEDRPQLFTALAGLWRASRDQGMFLTAQELSEDLFSLAQQQQDAGLLLRAHAEFGSLSLFRGELVASRAHLEQALALYDPEQHLTQVAQYGTDQGVFCEGLLAIALWYLGYLDQALQRSRDALILAQELAHPLSLQLAMGSAARTHEDRGEWPAAQALREAAIALASEHGFAQLLAWAMINRGRALVAQGQCDSGLEQMQQGFAAVPTTEMQLQRPVFLSYLAEAYGQAGDIDTGLGVIAEALEAADSTTQHLWDAELYRLRGELLLHADGGMRNVAWTPEACFHKAIDMARNQQAKSWELRAATSLARLWQSQDKRQDAYDLLAPVYAWFTEGFDTADLQDAKVLLRELKP